MFKTVRLSFLVVLTLAITLSFLYLIQRQEIYSDIKATNKKLAVTEISYFESLSEEWTQLLTRLSKQSSFKQYINALVKGENIAPYQQRIESMFNAIGSRRLKHIHYIRFIDAAGNEKVISENSRTVREYRNLADSNLFRQSLTTRAGKLTKVVFEKVKGNAYIHRSVPIVVNNKRVGILTISFDIKNLLSRYDYLLGLSVIDVVALVNHQGNVIYQTGAPDFDEKEAELVYAMIKRNKSLASTTEFKKNIWSFVKNEPYRFSVLFLSKGEKITKILNSEYQKIGIVIAISSFILVLLVIGSTRTTQRRENRAENKKVMTKQRSYTFASISDEIRQPIDSLLGSLTTLLETELNGQQKQYTDTAKKSAVCLLELVNEFQDYSKITQGNFQLDKIEFDLRLTVHDIVELISAQAYEKGLEVSCLVSSDVPKRVLGDVTRLRQVLINLVSYAVQHTENGEISLYISTRDHLADTKTVIIDISDTGNVLNQDEISQQISMFTDIDLDKAENFTGEGLGLALSKQLIELMSGQLSMRENSLGGNTFQVSIPLPVIEVVDQPEPRDNLNRKRVLIVGEIENNRNALSQTFAVWGMSGATMEEFDRVVNVLRDAVISNQAFHVCLIDVSLTSSSEKAFELVRQVREESAIDELALVMLTAQGMPGDARRAKDLGIQAYLTKPVGREDMHAAMLRIFSDSLDSKLDIVTKYSIKENESRKNRRILIAENDKTFSKQLVKYFNQADVLVDLANEGERAELAIKINAYDAVLISTSLPGLDVYSFVTEFRKDEDSLNSSLHSTTDEHTHHMPIIGLVSQYTKKTKETCRSCGMDDVIGRPIDEIRLQLFIDQYLFSSDPVIGSSPGSAVNEEK